MPDESPAEKATTKSSSKPAPQPRRMPLSEYALEADLSPVRERILRVRTAPRDRFTRSGWDQKLAQAMKQEV